MADDAATLPGRSSMREVDSAAQRCAWCGHPIGRRYTSCRAHRDLELALRAYYSPRQYRDLEAPRRGMG